VKKKPGLIALLVILAASIVAYLFLNHGADAWQAKLELEGFELPAADPADFSYPQAWTGTRGEQYEIDQIDGPNYYDPVLFKFLCNGQERFSISGTKLSIFRKVRDELFFLDYGQGSSGCTMRAFALPSGYERWMKELEVLGPVAHSVYSNRVSMRFASLNGSTNFYDQEIEIVGSESYGDYRAILDLVNGEELAHIIYRKGFGN
jgi:hypothetical protein